MLYVVLDSSLRHGISSKFTLIYFFHFVYFPHFVIDYSFVHSNSKLGLTNIKILDQKSKKNLTECKLAAKSGKSGNKPR